MHAVTIRQARPGEAEWLHTGFAQIGWRKQNGYFAECLEKQAKGEIVLLVAEIEGNFAGHVKVVWEPDYPYFYDEGIPEIQDLNVLPIYRRMGVATRLVDEAERIIRTRSNRAGIGFGLYADYGPAQRMYIRRGYIPDGHGVSYADRAVIPGELVRMDDDLVLYLVKSLD